MFGSWESATPEGAEWESVWDIASRQAEIKLSSLSVTVKNTSLSLMIGNSKNRTYPSTSQDLQRTTLLAVLLEGKNERGT